MAEQRKLLRRLGSVRARTTVLATAVMALALAVAAVALLLLVQRTVVSNLDQSAQARARDVAAQLRQRTLPSAPAVPDEENAIIQVLQGSRVLASSSNVEDEPAVFTLPAGASDVRTGTIRTPVGDGHTYRVVALPTGSETVVVALSTEQADETVRTVARVLAAGAPALLLLVAAMTWMVTGRSLRPVEQIRREVSDITASELDRRVVEPGNDDEVSRLARTMNDMLGRLEQAQGRQRQFVGDASHELRSPLAAARTEIEVALAHPEITCWPQTGEELLAEVVRMQRLVQDLLFLARRGEVATLPGHERVDLGQVVVGEVDRAQVAAPHLDLRVDAADAEVEGRSADLGRLVRNLLENAVRYARAQVLVGVHVGDGRVTVTVEDDGPGIPEAERSRVFERFARLDAGRGRDEGGSGLGLAIARDVAEAHHGSIEVTQRDLGARFVVMLPLPQGQAPLRPGEAEPRGQRPASA